MHCSAQAHRLSDAVQARDWLSSYWSGYNSPSQLSRIRNTGVPPEFPEGGVQPQMKPPICPGWPPENLYMLGGNHYIMPCQA